MPGREEKNYSKEIITVIIKGVRTINMTKNDSRLDWDGGIKAIRTEVIQERNHQGICLSCREMGSQETAGAVSDAGRTMAKDKVTCGGDFYLGTSDM